MTPMRRPVDVQRVRYWHGQQLRSSDLRAQRTTDEELRWWHNRAVHGAYGVVDGLKVTQTASGYRVEPGLAYDGYGRELIVPCPVDVAAPCKVEVPSPPGLVWWTLLLGYDEGTDRSVCAPRDDLGGACLPAGRCPGNEGIRFFWVPRKVESDCAGVPLARCTYACTTYTPDSFVPPKVQPLAQPRIVTGQTSRGYTGWEEWLEPVDPQTPDGDQYLLGFQLSVDTSAAGFAKTPCYFAWLDGPREWQSVGPVTNWRIPYDWIVDETAGGFTVRVPLIDDELPQGQKVLSLENFLIFVRCYGLYVCWMGIEERCPPPYEWCQECCP